MASYYPDNYWFTPEGAAGRLEEAYRRLVLRDHVSFVREALENSGGGDDGRVLDVGCGNGLLLRLLGRGKVVGLDFSRQALTLAWKQNGVPGACADLNSAPLAAASCSVITMFHLLEHLPDPARSLADARELLRPEGRLVVQVPNASCWQFRLFGARWNGIDAPRHLFNYRQRDIENLLDFCGFEVLRRKHFSLRDNPAGMASSIAPSLDPMARRVRGVREGSVHAARQGWGLFWVGACGASVHHGRSGLRRGIDDYDRGAQEGLKYRAIERFLPRVLRRHILHFEAAIEDALAAFARELPDGARVLDAGAGEMRHARHFGRQRYIGVDLAVGDAAWDYGKLDAIADLAALPFSDGCFGACINIVTLEHVRDPLAALREMERTLAPGGRALVIVPHEWEVHQSPHDFFRYTRHGMEHLLGAAGFAEWSVVAVGGYFRLLSRRLLNGLQFFPGPLFPLAALLVAPAALALPWLDALDRERNFTLGYICIARKRS